MESQYRQRAGRPPLAEWPSQSRAAISPQPYQFDALELPSDEETDSLGLKAAIDADLTVRIEVGRAELPLNEFAGLKQGSVVPLDKLADDPVDILVNNRLIARGEVVVLNDKFCIRIAEILATGF